MNLSQLMVITFSNRFILEFCTVEKQNINVLAPEKSEYFKDDSTSADEEFTRAVTKH
jgi:hypothetical protein